jgi:transcriptional regulator with XRE-family HTH domain
MIYEKIHAVREYLELSSTQVASLIKTNTYLYRKYESGSMDTPLETLIVLAIAYGIPIDSFLSHDVCVTDILKEPQIQQLHSVLIHERLSIMCQNICKQCSFPSRRVSYRVLSDIRNAYHIQLSTNLISIREAKGAKIAMVAEALNISEEEYESIEKGITFPPTAKILALAECFKVNLQSVMGKTYKDSK